MATGYKQLVYEVPIRRIIGPFPAGTQKGGTPVKQTSLPDEFPKAQFPGVSL